MSGYNDKGAGTTYKILLIDCMQKYTVQGDTRAQSAKMPPGPPLTDTVYVVKTGQYALIS